MNSYDASGRKLAARNFTNVVALSQPLNEGDVLKHVVDEYERVYINTVHNIGNVEYNSLTSYSFSTASTFESFQSNKLYNSEGYARDIFSSVTNPDYYYFCRDHLGNIREVWRGNRRTVVQRTQYYPSGLPWAKNPGDDTELPANANNRKHNGTEFIEMHGFDVSDHGNRGLFHAINRYTSIDRFAEKFPWQSPYVHAGNNPVKYVDVNGDSIWTTIKTTGTNPDGTSRIIEDKYYYGKDANGNYGFIGTNGNIYSGNDSFTNSLSNALSDLMNGGLVGNSLVTNLMNSSNNLEIAFGKNKADINGTFITWNPSSNTGGLNQIGTENRPSFIGLGHEMAHIQDNWRGTLDNSIWVNTGGISIPNSEKYATHIENQLRSENKLPLRTHYGIDASTGRRIGLESTRIINGNSSLFYSQPNSRSSIGIPLLSTPFIYK